jgi:signal transduction histidine kinase
MTTAQYLFGLTLLAGLIAGLRGWLDMRRLDFLLRALSEDSDIVDPRDVSALGKQAGRTCVDWLWPHVLALILFVTPMRPSLMDLTTGISLMLLCIAIAFIVALALYATLRDSFLKVIEVVPARIMTEVVVAQQNSAESRERISKRLTLAVVTPMVFVALGCALIANAHVRRADERHREEIARVMARSVFEADPSTLESVGLQGLYTKATDLGFPTQVIESKLPYSRRALEGGFVEVTTPLEGIESASAIVRFNGSSVWVLSTESLLFVLLAIVIAAGLGLTLGNALTEVLNYATEGVRLLGTRALLSSPPEQTRPPRFRIVRQLQRAVEGVAGRFRIFAQAQQDAIAARAAATRMRGQFFASVSHDLKSPLNSILGFTELVRMEPLTEGQAESLQVIADRGQELLTLIETILDAARIEVGQLSLMFDEEPFGELYATALEKATQLSGHSSMQIYEEIEPNLPPMIVDRIRGARAIATFIAYSIRATEGGQMWVRAERDGPHHVRIDIDVPARVHSAADLHQMLDPAGGLAKREHRGLALALQLASSVIKLHGGTVQVVDRRHKGSMFCLTLPTAAGLARGHQATLAPRPSPTDEPTTVETAAVLAMARPEPATVQTAALTRADAQEPITVETSAVPELVQPEADDAPDTDRSGGLAQASAASESSALADTEPPPAPPKPAANTPPRRKH